MKKHRPNRRDRGGRFGAPTRLSAIRGASGARMEKWRVRVGDMFGEQRLVDPADLSEGVQGLRLRF